MKQKALCLFLLGTACATSSSGISRPADRHLEPTWISRGDAEGAPQLAQLADEALEQALVEQGTEATRGVILAPALWKHDAGLTLAVVVLSFPERSLLGEIRVKASGTATARDMLRAMAPTALREAGRAFARGG